MGRSHARLLRWLLRLLGQFERIFDAVRQRQFALSESRMVDGRDVLNRHELQQVPRAHAHDSVNLPHARASEAIVSRHGRQRVQ